MKVCATMILHYGAQWLGPALESVRDCVDKVAIFHTPRPSHGHGTEAALPEGESYSALQDIAYATVDSSKLAWFSGGYVNEGAHRGHAEAWAQEEGYALMLIIDSDEVWYRESIEEAFQFAVAVKHARYFRFTFQHFWQGLDLVCRDQLMPHRLTNLRNLDVGTPVYHDLRDKPVCHMGYAISDELMRYKWAIHGHKDELRPDWFEKKWLARAVKDVHPTNENFWDAEPFRGELPGGLK